MESYWSRYRRKRVSRRSVLGRSGGGAVGLGALAIAGCWRLTTDDCSVGCGDYDEASRMKPATATATEAAGLKPPQKPPD